MSTVSVIVLLLYFLLWLVAFTAAFFRVDRPEARGNIVVVGNLIQAVFHIFVPFVPIFKAFDKTLPDIEFKVNKFYSISLPLIVVVIVVAVVTSL
jgi:uncharacterized protein YbbC (DUF1343 family)